MKALSGKKFNICLPFIAAIYQTQLNFLGLYHFLSKESIDGSSSIHMGTTTQFSYGIQHTPEFPLEIFVVKTIN